MSDFYIIRSNQYARMAKEFYDESLKERRFFEEGLNIPVSDEEKLGLYALLLEKTLKMDEKAIAAVLFQALAVEAYTNLFGITVFGEEDFYANYERAPTRKKLKEIAGKLNKTLPKEMDDRIKALFKKRDSFVHQKPKAYQIEVADFDYKNLEKNFEDINAYVEELMGAEEGLDDNMKIYEDLQECVRVLRGAELELTEEYKQGKL